MQSLGHEEKGSFQAIKEWFGKEPAESGVSRLISIC
jgi:hypothetical protein